MSGAPDRNSASEKKKRLAVSAFLRRLYNANPSEGEASPIPPGFIVPASLLQGSNAWLYEIVNFIARNKELRNALMGVSMRSASSWTIRNANDFGERLYMFISGSDLGIPEGAASMLTTRIGQAVGTMGELPLLLSLITESALAIIALIRASDDGAISEAKEAAASRSKTEQMEKQGTRLNQEGRERVARNVWNALGRDPAAIDDENALNSMIESEFKKDILNTQRGSVRKDRHKRLIKEMVKLLAISPPEEPQGEPEAPANLLDDPPAQAAPGEPPMLDAQLLEEKSQAPSDVGLAQQQVNFAAGIASEEPQLIRQPIDVASNPELDAVNSNIPEPAPAENIEQKWNDPDSSGGNTGAGGRPENLFTASIASAIPGSEPLNARGLPPSVARNLADRDIDIGVRDDNRGSNNEFDIGRRNVLKFHRNAKTVIGRPGTMPARIVAKTKNRDDTQAQGATELNKRKHDIIEKINLGVSQLKQSLPDEQKATLNVGIEIIAGHLAETVVASGNVEPWVGQLEFASIIGSILFAEDVATAIAGVSGVASGIGVAPALVIGALGLVALNQWFTTIEPTEQKQGEGMEEKGEGMEEKGEDIPGEGDQPGSAEQPGAGIGALPDQLAPQVDRLIRLDLRHIGAALGALALEHPTVDNWLRNNFGPNWKKTASTLNDIKAYLQDAVGGTGGAIPQRVKQALRWGEQKIDITAADRAAIQQSHRGDIQPLQDQDKERRVGDLRPSFRQLGTIADDETSEEAMRERLKFASFNYVPPGHGASRDNIIARTNNAWDEHIRYTQPIDTSRYQRYDTRQLLDFRAPAGVSASRGYTNPMTVGYLRNSMRREGIPHDMLLRDVHNNNANFQPVQGLNRTNPSIPLSNIHNTTMDWNGYYMSDPVNNPPEGTTQRIVRQRGTDPGPYKFLPAGYSTNIPPYQYGTYYDNSYPRNGAPQYVQSFARGSNDVPYKPLGSRMPAGLDISSMNLLPKVPFNITDPRIAQGRPGNLLKFPQSVSLDRA
jgi:hypothetical protein